MGLFDSIAGQVLGSLSQQTGGRSSALVDAIGGLLTHAESGGLAGLVDAFRRGGLGNVVDSWIGTGHNLPVSADQLQSVLGSARIQALARQLGLSTEEASGQLAELLPKVIDGLTPNGALPEEGGPGGLLAVLKGLGR